MATEAVKQLDAFKDDCKKEAEVLVKTVFPTKVVDLNSLLLSEGFSFSKLATLESDLNIPIPEPLVNNHDAEPHVTNKKRKVEMVNNDFDIPGTKVYALPNGICPMNKHIREMIDTLKPHIMDLIDYTNKVKMWISFSIPKVEDGNNFGVSIQEDIMAESRQVESEAATYLDQISRYYLTRGKMVSKVAKYPHVVDYRESVKELDEKEFVSLRLIVTELRNHYASLHDIIMKNLEKIKKPRSLNTENMY